MTKKRHLITAALPYANGPLHVGHVAGAYLPADIYVRYLRGLGEDVLFICGSDEHGAAITIQAKKEDISPQEIVDTYHPRLKNGFDALLVSFDIYHRTSSRLHHTTAADFFKVLEANGAFEKKTTNQFYDADFDQFLADRYVKGTCPKCDNPEAYGDQCENCGSTLSPNELINPVSTLSGKVPELKETSHFYLKLNEHQDWLSEWINKGSFEGKQLHDPKTWKKNVMGQVNSWLNDGLVARAITRDLNWGVPVPVEGMEGKVLYVWLDAPIGYISASKQWAIDQGKPEAWKDYWQSEDTRLLHFIGKDNIVFHSIIFPAILKAHGDYILPENVPANEFMNLEGDKISTSRNWAIWVDEFLTAHPDKVDELRYALCSNLPEAKDSEFTWADFQSKVNNELVATYGNFVNRVMVLTQKYYDGVVPEADLATTINCGVTLNTDSTFQSEMNDLLNRSKRMGKAIETYKFREALQEMIAIASFGNSFLQFNEPWKQVKEHPEKVKTIMLTALQIVAGLAIVSEPILPIASNRIKASLGLSISWAEYLELLNQKQLIVKPGASVMQADLLFEKIEDEWTAGEKAKLVKPAAAIAVDLKADIQFDDFAKLDLRTGKIIEAELHPDANKLLVIKVDMGFEERTIVSGIAKHYKPAEIIGQQVCVVANLSPKKLRGVMSQGMILMAENEAGELCFLQPEKDYNPGSSVS